MLRKIREAVKKISEEPWGLISKALTVATSFVAGLGGLGLFNKCYNEAYDIGYDTYTSELSCPVYVHGTSFVNPTELIEKTIALDRNLMILASSGLISLLLYALQKNGQNCGQKRRLCNQLHIETLAAFGLCAGGYYAIYSVGCLAILPRVILSGCHDAWKYHAPVNQKEFLTGVVPYITFASAGVLAITTFFSSYREGKASHNTRALGMATDNNNSSTRSRSHHV